MHPCYTNQCTVITGCWLAWRKYIFNKLYNIQYNNIVLPGCHSKPSVCFSLYLSENLSTSTMKTKAAINTWLNILWGWGIQKILYLANEGFLSPPPPTPITRGMGSQRGEGSNLDFQFWETERNWSVHIMTSTWYNIDLEKNSWREASFVANTHFLTFCFDGSLHKIRQLTHTSS